MPDKKTARVNATKFPPFKGTEREKFILRSADAFHQTAQLALRCPASEQERFHLGLAYGVNGAFAVELYLKCLLAVENRRIPKIHNLVSLFERVSPDSREKLKRRHDELETNNTVLSEFRKKGIKTDLDSLLRHAQDVFEQFRYMFEAVPDRMEPLGFALDLFGQIVRNRILDLRPEWVSTEFPSAPELRRG
jgi:hypothetical protein